jgi:two-component system LytT family response regulator
MLLKAIIVDDHKNSRELIQSFCESYSNGVIQIAALCPSVDTALVAIEAHKPDLVFLDIDMPEKNGFELINNFDVLPFEVVFVTGHANQYTKAIEISAMNYLMKPINPLNIKAIVEQFETKIALANTVNRNEILKNNLNGTKNTILFPSNDGFIVIDTTDIISCQSQNGTGKCSIVTTTDTIVIHKYLKDVLSLLPESSFIKVSSSAIINKKKIASFSSKTYTLKMSNGSNIKVSDAFYNKTKLIDALAN